MRVQRAPAAAEQPQRPPAGIDVARRTAVATAASTMSEPTFSADAAAEPGSSFCAEIDLDLTSLLKLLDESQVVAEIVVRLVAACRQEQLIDDESALRVVRPTDEGMVGVQFDHAVHQSAYSISSGMKSPSPELPAATASTLTVVSLRRARVRVTGDWGLGGLGVVTLGPVVPTVVPQPQASGAGLIITQRRVARLGFTVQSSSAQARDVVRILDIVARSVEGREW